MPDSESRMNANSGRGSALRAEFLASISHEIRTPMNGVLGMAELLAGTDLTEKQKTFVDVITRSGHALLTIVNDVLDIARLDVGALTLAETEFDLAETVSEALAAVSGAAADKDIDLDVTIQPGLPSRLVGDQVRIRQILATLAGSAIARTETGEVRIDVRGTCAGDMADIRIDVISAPDGRTANEAKNTAPTPAEGDGKAGLADLLADRLARLMGGAVMDERASGGVLTLHLPLRAARAVVPVAATSSRSLPAGTRPAIEHGLPAIGVLQRQSPLSGAGRTGRSFGEAMAALTSDGRAGRVGVLPASPRIVERTAQPAVGSQPAPRQATGDGSPAPRLHAKPALAPSPTEDTTGAPDILVAEDNEVNRLVVTQILDGSGYSFRIVENGELAVAAYEEARPRLILMDVSMPVMNGLEATAAIRDLEADLGVHVTIVGVTAHALKGDRDRCLASGMDDYLPKPVSPEKLMTKLHDWLGPPQRLRKAG